MDLANPNFLLSFAKVGRMVSTSVSGMVSAWRVVRGWRDGHDNSSAVAQFHQQTARALWIPPGQAGAYRTQQSRSGRLRKRGITPRC